MNSLLSGDRLSLEVLGSLDRWQRLPPKKMQITGADSVLSLAALLLWSSGDSEPPFPHVAVLPRSDDVKKLEEALSFLSPTARPLVLPEFDVGPYSNLYPNRRLIAQRLRWLFRAQRAQPGEIFIASVGALLQRTLPFEVLYSGIQTLRPQDPLPKEFAQCWAQLGYTQSPLVEDVGTFAVRGGIVDVFSPAHTQPLRLDLFGSTIETIKYFDPETQRSGDACGELNIIPSIEVLFSDDRRQRAAQLVAQSVKDRGLDQEEVQTILHSLSQGQYFHGIEFLVSAFYSVPALPLEHFSSPVCLWRLDPVESARHYDQFFAALKDEFESSESAVIRPQPHEVFGHIEHLLEPPGSHVAEILRLEIAGPAEFSESDSLSFSSNSLKEFSSAAKALAAHPQEVSDFLGAKLEEWKQSGYSVFFSTSTQSQSQRLRLWLERTHFHGRVVEEGVAHWGTWCQEQFEDPRLIHIVPRHIPEAIRWTQDKVILLRDEDVFGKRQVRRARAPIQPESEIHKDALSFSDLRPGDLIVHKLHGIGIYEGLKVMDISGIAAELLQLRYKDNDRLYLPVFRISQIHKFSNPAASHPLDKLGGTSWEKAKTKVRSHLRDLADELLQLYALRTQISRPAYSQPTGDFLAFESAFPYDETEDQLRAIQDVISDLTHEKPMDRLICGDVGFGKTEVAMRAAFKVVEDHKQVAIIAPTTVLTFQHTQTFKKRFKDWPVAIHALNRFVPNSEIKKTLAGLKSGAVDVVIGTHRLLSRDVGFKNLGLLIVDEEQKFGVQHKERLRQLRKNVDTLAMSATPIPRTMNMSLMGLRDLSIINTPPTDRLPTRTFVCKFDPETIRKAVYSEISRGGQVFFIHNRIESLYGLMDELSEMLPDVRMKMAHGQMPEGELEKVMIAFFNHEIDMLVCTTIIESGLDVPNANTMFIDSSHQLGLSQLYQLRGRVGRSKERAYCYLLIPPHRRIDPDAQERLRVIQENTALGSGVRIAQYDLELRGAGDILGEQQSGHINAVGYEMYLELLDEAVKGLKGEAIEEAIEPEINVRIPALIPDSYIGDVRIRLSYYRALANIQGPEDMDRMEDQFRDQFGKPPETVINLMGLMLIRRLCKTLSVRDLSSGKIGVSLLFTERTPLATQTVLELAARGNKKYSVTPDSRLHIRMNDLTWPRIYEELNYLIGLCPGRPR